MNPSQQQDVGQQAKLSSIGNSTTSLQAEINKLQLEKQQQIDMSSSTEWRDRLRHELEAEIERRVREALDTPPEERLRRNRELARLKAAADAQLVRYRQTSRLLAEQRSRALRLESAERRRRNQLIYETASRNSNSNSVDILKLDASTSTTDRVPSYQHFASDCRDERSDIPEVSLSSSIKRVTFAEVDDDDYQSSNIRRGHEAMRHFGDLSELEKYLLFQNFTKAGFREALKTGKMPDGSTLIALPSGQFKDQFGIIRDIHGPFWPKDFGPCHPTPQHHRLPFPSLEPLLCPQKNASEEPSTTHDNQKIVYTGNWRGTQIIYDSDKSPRFYTPPPLHESVCPSLVFESRFECGNLRQVRRIGMFEYELVLRTDLYTKRHTQWYYFKVHNVQPKITYKFVIVNLLKPTSLYNEGMKPLFYSDKVVVNRGLGWHRAGHHIRYSRNATRLQSALLERDMAYYQLEWQMEFPYAEDHCYLAHCYPYTYSDLRHDLTLLAKSEQSKNIYNEEILCESRAGNSCFCVTVTDKSVSDEDKLGIVITARVHPGEANSSWMMKGLLDYVTGSSEAASSLRRHFIFKIIPMLNPDGVIVGNYRTSLAAKDLNRNYRHPKEESFPSIYHTKRLLENFSKERSVLLYCDMHGHSRKPNVFMYGCDAQYRKVDPQNTNSLKLKTSPENFLNERLFPWLMSKTAPDLFSYQGCRFNIRRCKEATGRVVMWRQFEINNSFTMEATFCGTSLSRSDSRHFNTSDLEQMGGALSQTLLEYKKVKEDKTKQSQCVVDMTVDLLVNMLKHQNDNMNKQLQQFQQNSDDSDKTSSSTETTVRQLRQLFCKDKATADRFTKLLQSDGPLLLLDQLSLETMDDCSDILSKIDTSRLNDSDSSDSDSESEPEAPLEEDYYSIYKRNKKKSKKSRRRKDGIETKRRAAAQRHKQPVTVSYSSQCEFGDSKLVLLPTEDFILDMSNFAENKNRKNFQNRFKMPTNPKFVNKFEGRHNHGIPCFSEERLLERANKKLYLMHSAMERDRAKDFVYSRINEDNFLEVRKDLVHLDNIQYRLRNALGRHDDSEDQSDSETGDHDILLADRSAMTASASCIKPTKQPSLAAEIAARRRLPKFTHQQQQITPRRSSLTNCLTVQSNNSVATNNNEDVAPLSIGHHHPSRQPIKITNNHPRSHKLPSLTNYHPYH